MNFKKPENESLLMFSEFPVTSRGFDIPGDEWNPGRKSFASQANRRKVACHSKIRCFFVYSTRYVFWKYLSQIEKCTKTFFGYICT